MPVELKDLLSYIGVELAEDADLDTFKKAFAERFTKTSDVPNIEDLKGESTRRTAKLLRETAKENGIELTDDESKLPVAELARLIPSKVAELSAVKIQELEKAGKKPSEAMEALQVKFDALTGKLTDVTTMKDDLATRLTSKEKEFGEFTKGYELKSSKDGMFKNLGGMFSDTADDMKRQGFFAIQDGKYNMFLDENGKFDISDKEGKRIANPDKHGEFLTPEQVYVRDMKAMEVYKEIDTKRQQPPAPTPQPVISKEGIRGNGRPLAPPRVN